MSRTDRLDDFVHAGLAAGQSRDALAGALRDAGWTAREMDEALGGWAPAAPGVPPVPVPRPYVSAVEALIYGLLFLLLGCICWHIAALGMRIIDWMVPDPGDFYGPTPHSLRWSIAVLIPTVPLFLWLNARVARGTRGDPGRRRSLVRKWFAAITLLIASLTLLADLVAVVFALLNGDLTLRFVAKAVLVAAIGAAAFAYYRGEIDAG